MPVTPSASESKHQIAVVEWLRRRKHHVFSVPNEGRRDPRVAQRLKRQGMVPGIPDLIITHRDGRRPIMIEMKDETGELSDTQVDTQATLMRFGWPVYTCNTGKAAHDLLVRLGF